MDIKEYIASGIIESYVLGYSSDQERREVECMSKIYPELMEEITSVRSSLEKYADSIAITPPSELKNSILSKIKFVQQEQLNTTNEQPTSANNESRAEGKIIQMVPKSMKIGMAASVALVIGLGTLFLIQRNSTAELNNQLAEIEKDKQQTEEKFSSEIKILTASLDQNKSFQAFILDESTSKIDLAGTEVSPESKVRAYFNSTDSKVIVVADNLPLAASGKQYQLWAIADGVPVDLGVLDKDNTVSNERVVKASNIQAFAITLEKEGGNPTPTLDQLYVIGNV